MHIPFSPFPLSPLSLHLRLSLTTRIFPTQWMRPRSQTSSAFTPSETGIGTSRRLVQRAGTASTRDLIGSHSSWSSSISNACACLVLGQKIIIITSFFLLVVHVLHSNIILPSVVRYYLVLLVYETWHDVLALNENVCALFGHWSPKKLDLEPT